jgi:hypothetical protein
MPMDQAPPVDLRPIGTMQPMGRDIRRMAQFAKFFTHQTLFEPFVSAAPGTVARQTFTAEGQVAAFQIMLIAVSADNLGDKLLVTLTPNGEQFMFEPMYLSQLGSGQYPYKVPPGITIRRNNIITAIIEEAKLVPANNNIRIAYFGAKIYEQPLTGPRRYLNAKPWWYPANFTAQDSGQGALAANGTRTYVVRVDSDSDFEVQKLTVVSDAPVLIQIQTDADDWFDQPIRSELLGGSLIELVVPPGPSGWRPFMLPVPRLVTGAAYIRTVVTNTVAAANRCEIQYHGVRLYPANGA